MYSSRSARCLRAGRPSAELSQFPDIHVSADRAGVCSVGNNAAGTGLREVAEECGKADLQFGGPEYHVKVLIWVFPVSAGWSSG